MNRACCDWETFKSGFMAHWRYDKATPGAALIDWAKAETDHRKGLTGFEAAFMQLRAMREDGEYNYTVKTT